MTEKTQSELNAEMLGMGAERYRRQAEKSKGSITHAGRRILRDAVEPVWEALVATLERVSAFKNKSQWQVDMVDIPHDKLKPLTLLALKEALDSLHEPVAFVSLAARIGRNIEDQLLSDFLIRNHEIGSRLVRRFQKLSKKSTQTRYLHKTAQKENVGWVDWPRRCRIGCGSLMLELIHAHTGLIQFTEKTHRVRKHYKPQRLVEISDETRKWIEDYDHHREVLLPFWLPMVDSPIPWESVYGGGYGFKREDTLPVLPFIRCSDRSLLRDAPPMPEVYEAVNHIQETPWAINSRVLETLEWAWEKDMRVGLPPRFEDPLPIIPKNFEDKEKLSEMRDLVRETALWNKAQASKRVLITRILMLARKFEGQRMFMPCSVDFRGRVYQIPSFLTYQGPDHCRGLLKFHRGVAIKSDDDLKWLGIHGANSFGNDKDPFEARLKWAEENTALAHRIAKDPRSNQEWTEADSPWQFLAWCFEWSAYHSRDSKNFLSHLPCAMDATNSGLQLLSLLARDTEGCEATNVAPTDSPADIYRLVAEDTQRKIEQDARDGKEFASKWLEFGLTRKLSKRPVMCYPYGLTAYSARDYVKDWYITTKEERGVDCMFGKRKVYPAVKYLGNHLWDSIGSLLTKPKEVMDWFQQAASAKAAQNKPLTWMTPTGFKVTQDYRKQVSRKVSTWLHGSLTAVRFRDDTDDIDPRKQSNGASPNIVHSLDASGLVRSVNEGYHRGIADFAVIHDSYATHSTNGDLLAAAIKDSFAELFSQNILADLQSQWEDDGTELLPLPEFGEFDPSEVKNSKYFFS